ncbi:MAG: cytochrome P450 [Chloroflexota bacterium]
MNFDPRSPEFRSNPYPTYALLREHAPIFYWEEWEMWFLSTYEDCQALLRDPRLGNFPPGTSMLFQNPPDHTRMRSLVQKAFTPRMIEKQREQVQATTDRLLDPVQGQGHMDIVKELAYPLPVAVIAEMMGVPVEDHAKFHEWSVALVNTLDLSRDPVKDERGTDAEIAFEEYFAELIARRRKAPSDDLISALIAAEEEGDKLSARELYLNSRLLLIAGYETTVGLIGNGLYALLTNPEECKRLQADPMLIKGAIEELLRFDGPIQMVSRRAGEDIHYKGVTFAKDASVSFLLGSANRDPARFPDADFLDITRQSVQHMSFGAGIHYCLGAPLARLEGQIAINTVLRRMPNIFLAIDSPPYRDNYVFRGLESLPVSF